MMRSALFSAALVLGLSASTVWAEDPVINPAPTAPAGEEPKFQEKKAEVLDELNKKEECIEGATDKEGMKACRKGARERRHERRADRLEKKQERLKKRQENLDRKKTQSLAPKSP
jgi:hypothetical protein